MYIKTNITPAQVRSARGLLNWSQSELASQSGITSVTIANFENSQCTPKPKTLNQLISTFHRFGVSFMGESGVMLDQNFIKIYYSEDGLKEFFHEVFYTLELHGSIIRISGVDERKFRQALGDEFTDMHIQRVQSLPMRQVRVITTNALVDLKVPYAQYKVISSKFFKPIPCYIFHNKLAHIIWNPLKVIIIENDDLADANANQFDLIWEKASESVPSE